MKFSCLQDNLSKGLAIVSRAVATRAPLPITQNILLEVDDSKIKITATNLEIAISTWVPGKTENEGSLTIPARMFTDFINSLPSGDQVDISNTEGNKGIEIKSKLFLKDVVSELLNTENISILSGPCFSHEVAQNLPTAVTLASPKRNIFDDIFS